MEKNQATNNLINMLSATAFRAHAKALGFSLPSTPANYAAVHDIILPLLLKSYINYCVLSEEQMKVHIIF